MRAFLKIVSDLARAGLLLLAAVRWGFRPAVAAAFGKPLPLQETGRRLRLFLERMGLTYVKLGQYLAMRFDLLPPALVQELERLFDRATPVAFAQVRRRVEEELGAPLDRLFLSFDPEPLGAASVAQVHRAVAHDGEALAVKVQRPGIVPRFQSDIRLLLGAAWLADRFRLMGRLSLVETLREFADFTAREMDFVLEGETADRLRRQALRCYVPRVRWDLTSRGVLAMELIEGVSFLTLCEPGAEPPPGVDLERALDDLAEECLHQFFETGFFHGDPHPANVLVEPGGRVVFIDCGIFGELSAEHRQALRRHLEALAEGRFAESAHAYLRVCLPTAWTDEAAFERELASVLAEWATLVRTPGVPVAQRHMGHLESEVVAVLRRHDVRTRPAQVLVWRAMILLDSSALRMPVRFDVLAAMARFFARRRRPLERRAWEAVAGLPEEVLGEAGVLARSGRLLRTAERGTRPLAVRRERPASWLRRRAESAGLAAALGGVALASLPAALPEGAPRLAAVAAALLCLLVSLAAAGVGRSAG